MATSICCQADKYKKQDYNECLKEIGKINKGAVKKAEQELKKKK